MATNQFQPLAEKITELMERLQVPGVAVGIWHGGEAYTAGFGVTNVEHPLPVDENSLFQIGSTTKTVTGTAVMRLVEQGRLDLDTPIRAYLPDLRLADADVAARVTMRHLLTHLGGWVGDFFEETGLGEAALATYVAHMADLPQLTPLGAVWAYNNAGFSLAGRVIEVVTGQPYEAAVQELVLDPLAMNMSFFFAHDAITHRVAVGHEVLADGPVVARPWALARSAHAAGGIISTAVDQLKYARFQLGDGTAASGERLLRPETMRLMQSPQAPANLGREIGLSWLLKTVGGVRVVMHGGATKGQLSAFLLVPEHDFALTVLTNANLGSVLNDEVTAWALEHYLGLVEPEPMHLERPPEEVAPYLGRYTGHLSDAELSLHDGDIILQVIPKGGFPDKDSPPSPAPPPVRVAFTAADQLITLDEPLKGMRGEFLRDEDGRIVWFRTSRLHRREA